MEIWANQIPLSMWQKKEKKKKNPNMLNKWTINLVFWETGTRGGYQEVIYHFKGGAVPLNAICNDL